MRRVTFFWWAAVALSLWELLVDPMFAVSYGVICTSAVPLEMPPPSLLAEAAEFLGRWSALLQPALLAMIALWAIMSPARLGATGSGRATGPLPDRPGRAAGLFPAGLGLAVALLPAALAEAEERLSPVEPFWWRECVESQLPTPSFVVPRLILAWLLSPAVMVLLAGIAASGTRPRLTDLRNSGAAGAAVILAALLPGLLTGPPHNADGTPRFALADTVVLDLETGEPVSSVPEATRTYASYPYIVRDTKAGHYVAAVSSPAGRYFRLYRLAMRADGRVTVGERLTPTLEGMVNGLAVSPEGGVAYGRMTDDGSFVGTPDREWPASGHGVQWMDARTLVLPSHSVPASKLATLDVATGTMGDVAAPAEHEFTRPLLVLPGGRQLRALGWPSRKLVLHEGTRLVKTVLTLECGHIESLAADPTGRHLLVGVDREAEELDRSPLTGLPPCGGAPSELLRLDLESGVTQVVPGEHGPWIQAW